VGDIGIDEYYEVDASRVVQKYAIPVMLASNNSPHIATLGMAGNVCNQFRHFNVDVKFCGLYDDYAFDLLNKSNINTEVIRLKEGYNIPVKRRYNQAGFPLCRLDVEKSAKEIFSAHHKGLDLLARDYNSSPAPDIVILSDYNKGLFTMMFIDGSDKTASLL
jgi:bifunctional ADP-heptose synthase (sugar kinase/adenylyltransferase)